MSTVYEDHYVWSIQSFDWSSFVDSFISILKYWYKLIYINFYYKTKTYFDCHYKHIDQGTFNKKYFLDIEGFWIFFHYVHYLRVKWRK